MQKILVSDLARELGNSTASIYQKIKAGTLKAEKIGSKTYVIVQDHIKKEEFKSASQVIDNKDLEHLQELLKLKNEEITNLKDSYKELIKSKDAEIETLKISLSAFTMIFNRQIEPSKTIFEAEIEPDQEIKKDRKKKKKRKG